MAVVSGPRHTHCPVPEGAAGCLPTPNDPDAFRSFLAEGIQELGATKVEELLLVWLGWFLALVRAVQTEARFHPSTNPCCSPTSKRPLLI